MYQHDMSGEKEMKRKKLLPTGWRDAEIISCREATSKGGNEMFVFEFKDILTEYTEDVYAISEKGKRWFLKQILTACGISAGQDGIYSWDIPDVIKKQIRVLIEHEPNTYINRVGEEIHTVQHKITEIKKSEEVAWDDRGDVPG